MTFHVCHLLRYYLITSKLLIYVILGNISPVLAGLQFYAPNCGRGQGRLVGLRRENRPIPFCWLPGSEIFTEEITVHQEQQLISISRVCQSTFLFLFLFSDQQNSPIRLLKLPAVTKQFLLLKNPCPSSSWLFFQSTKVLVQ